MTEKQDNVIRLVHNEKPEGCSKTMELAAQLDWAAVVISGWVTTDDGMMEHVIYQTATYQDALWLLERGKLAVMTEHDYNQEEEHD